ncbi:MAG TPA: class I SAM-dependent methyltransferase [Thermodesulfobacteriota bacterium]|nr:class I SAM-dependent methyltransferase [Thermodesulfobacteriota bacterium]
MTAKPDYGNWVSKRLIFAPSMIGLIFFGLAFWIWFSSIPAGLFLLGSAYLAYARYRFSSQGGNVQDQIRALVLAHLDWNGKGLALDIGCGNAALTIHLARKYAGAQVIGIDDWGSRWEYSKIRCERNAKVEGVDEQVIFQKASASALPFKDNCFDAVVSNLVFHEVSDEGDKRAVIREALRVVKKGGKFAFQDLFLAKRLYGNTEDLVRTIRSWGITEVEFVETRNATFIPTMLRLPFMLGTIGLIAGKK